MTSSHIVVGIDGSPPSQAALQWAAFLARTTQWGLLAVHVLEWPIGLDGGGSRTGPEVGSSSFGLRRRCVLPERDDACLRGSRAPAGLAASIR
jgi:hypothetical protein